MLLTIPRRRGETRSDAEILAILDGQGSYSDSGTLVTTSTALQQATVWACVRILSEVIGQLPVMVQTRNDSGQWVGTEHDVLQLIYEPNGWQSSHEFFAHLVMWGELRGNGYYTKFTNAQGNITRLVPLQADNVTPKDAPGFDLIYSVSNSKVRSGTYSSDEILHYRNFGGDGYCGLSTIEYMRQSVGLAISTEQHGARLFKHGAQPGLVLTVPSATDEQVTALQKKIDDKYTGSLRSHKTMILRGDMSVTKIGMTQNDAQFLETRRFSKQEIASIFGVPLFMLNDVQQSTTWGTGLEQQLRAFKTLSLGPRLSRLSKTLARELLERNSRRTTRFVFDTDELTLGDFKDRMEGYRAAIESGVLSPNEAREVEGRNPREGGDEFRIPLNTERESNV